MRHKEEIQKLPKLPNGKRYIGLLAEAAEYFFRDTKEKFVLHVHLVRKMGTNGQTDSQTEMSNE